jgi:amino acid adenylation domain-containing protein
VFSGKIWRVAAGDLQTPDLISRFAVEHPELTALWDGGQSTTYRELLGRADAIATQLVGEGVGPGSFVGLCAERSAEQLIAMLAVFRTGAIFLPLDPLNPEGRLAQMVHAAKPKVVMTDATGALALRSARAPTLDLLEVAQRPRLAAFAPARRVSPEDVAYCMFTSGSTGRPKGVLVPHGALLNHVRSTRAIFELSANDRVLQFYSLGSDAALEEVFPAWTAGAAVVVRSNHVPGPGSELAEILRTGGITVLDLPTAYWHEWVDELVRISSDVPPGLRLVILGGERADERRVAAFRDRSRGRVTLLNTYGPTEATIIATVSDLTRPKQDPIPIGRPLPNVEVHLLDERLAPVEQGASGEICIGGAGLALGYLDLPEETLARFVALPFGPPGARLYRTGDLGRWRPDGELDFLGRVDDQVKIRGHRVEPREIAVVLERNPGVRSAVVLARRVDERPIELVAFVVAKSAPAPSAADLRDHLSVELPEAMIPSSFVFVSELPLTVRGKVDRDALLALPIAARGHDVAPPMDALEGHIHRIWSEVLGVESFGREDDLFDLGGDSLKGAIIANRLTDLLAERVYVIAIFDAPTIASLAAYLREHYAAAVAKLTPSRSMGDEASPHRAVRQEDIARVAPLLVRLPAHSSIAPRARKNRSLALVLCPPRSGSTLLRVMLAGHSKLFAPQELALLDLWNVSQLEKDSYRWNGQGFIRALMEAKGCDAESAREIVAGLVRVGAPTTDLYAMLQDEIGDRMLVDKTTEYALDPRVLLRAEEEFDRPIYIHLIRDPRGMIRSWVNARMDRIYFRDHVDYSNEQLAEIAWTISHQNVLQFLRTVPESRAVRVRFEDLVKDPRTHLTRICERLGIEFEPSMLDVYADPKRRMLDGLHESAASTMIGDPNFMKHSRIEAAVADEWRKHANDSRLGAPTIEIAKMFGYDDVEAPLD